MDRTRLEPIVLWLPGGVRNELHATGDDTGGAFCLSVDFPPTGWSLPSHRHLREAETIHVLEGRFDIVIDGDRTELGPGETIRIPAGVLHSGGNIGRAPGKRVVIFSPAGPEKFFLEIGASEPGQSFDMRAVLEAATRHGFVFEADGA